MPVTILPCPVFIDLFVQVLNKKRNIGGRGSTPHLVAIIPLHHDVDINQFLEKIKESVDAEEESAFNSRLNGFTINVARLRHTFTVGLLSKNH